ncbi:unnamed protein product [Eruca vesicaria subsp. sativa]|uniref:Uncharacterized protein n=1 Tax=Eruca vesicaria subsp. sativa TaxID=29727 RepID=A0ABC8KKT6_ERUVS|nr:unnamed protein product [Eruca vesicaria subsp. sativa]
MKRKRCEMEEATKKKKMTEIGSAIEELSVLSIAKTTIVTTEIEANNIINLPLKPLLSFCKLIIQVLDKIGPTMAVLRQDIDQNIQLGGPKPFISFETTWTGSTSLPCIQEIRGDVGI